MINNMTYKEALVKVRGYLTSYLPLDDESEIDEIMQALQKPKGKWIPTHPLQEDDCGAYMCSCCRVGNWGIDPKVDKYCFNCGAEMGDKE